MKKILYTLLFGLFLTGCGEPDNTEPDVPTEMVVIMYAIADSNLYGDIKNNVDNALKSMTRDNFSASSRFFVLFDGGDGDESCYLSELVPPKKSKAAYWKAIETYEKFESCDPNAMKELLTHIKEIAPSENYGIIFSSHGSGWLPEEAGQISEHRVPAIDGAPYELEYDLSWLYSSPNPITRWIGPDNYNLGGLSGATFMSMEEMVEGLSPIHFDFVMFDACFMNSVELLYALRNSTDYVVAAPNEVMAYGFPYQNITPLFFQNEIAIEQRLIDVANTIVNFYSRIDLNIVRRRSSAISITKMSEMENLSKAVRKINRYEENDSVIISEVKAYEGLRSHVFFDLNDYLSKLSGSKELYEQYVEQYGRTIVFERHTPKLYEGYSYSEYDASWACGISTYIPQPEKPVFEGFWRDTEWAKAISSEN